MRPAYVGAMLAVILLIGTVNASYSAEPDVKVFAKEKRNTIVVLVKNEQGQNIHGIKLKLLEGKINSVEVPRGWAIDTSASDTANIFMRTTKAPIKTGERAFIFIDVSKPGTIISWSVLNSLGSTFDSDETRIVMREKIEYQPPPAAEPENSPRIVQLAVTTDKIIYGPNDKMIISGTMTPNANLIITIYTPGGEKIKITDETDANGSFKVLHLLRDAESGKYNLKVRQSDATVEIVFMVQ